MNVPETFFTVSEELRLFGLSCAGGAALGLCYDLLRALRRSFPHRSWAVAAEDMLFLGGWLFFLLSFSGVAAHGEIRGYFVIGSASGFGLYLFTLGRPVCRLLTGVISLIRRLLKRMIAPAVSAYVLLCKKVKPIFVGIPKVIVKSIKKIRMLLHKPSVLLYNKMENKKGKNVELIGEKNQRQN